MYRVVIETEDGRTFVRHECEELGDAQAWCGELWEVADEGLRARLRGLSVESDDGRGWTFKAFRVGSQTVTNAGMGFPDGYEILAACAQEAGLDEGDGEAGIEGDFDLHRYVARCADGMRVDGAKWQWFGVEVQRIV